MLMDYISTREAAIKWGVSLRYVQRLLHENRIPDVKKYSGSWLVPADSVKPADPRKARKDGNGKLPYIFFSTTPLPKGNPDAALPTLLEKYRALAAADIAYRRGNPKPAKAYWRQADRFDETKLSAASLATATAISSGDYALYYEIERFLKGGMAAAKSAEEKALLSLPGTLAAVSMAATNMVPEWLIHCDFSLFPPELIPFLLYLHAMYLRDIGDKASLLSTARTAFLLCAQTNTFTWMDLYFLLLCALASFSLGDEMQAEKYLSEALDLGMPCGFVMPFADGLGEFGGMLERLIERRYPEQLEPLTRLWSYSFGNWARFHNEFTRENITTILTAQEYQVAHLIVHGATYAGTAQRMNLSASRIKNILSDIYGKLYIKNRYQLRNFIL